MPILAGWIRKLVLGRPWAHASPFPSSSSQRCDHLLLQLCCRRSRLSAFRMPAPLLVLVLSVVDAATWSSLGARPKKELGHWHQHGLSMPFCNISTRAFSAVVIGSPVGVTRVQKAHASEFNVHVRWKPVWISDVYWNNNMIEQVKGNWKLNLRDNAFAFPGIWETFQRHVEPSFALM